jgi:alpha-L-fucosidase
MKSSIVFQRGFGRVAFVLALTLAASSTPAQAQTRYTASWASVDTHPASPEWFMDAKFGIYYHWGPWCVAAYGSEWYPRNMYHTGSGEYNNQVAKYGDPFADWPYDKFLTGANDKQGRLTIFAPKLKSAGGSWDPDEWAQMFADAGAKFAGPVAEHHDGFSMWDSKVNEWNSVAIGPKLNLAKYQVEAIRKKGLKIIMSQHTAFNITGYYDTAPVAATTSLKKLYGQLPSAEGQTLWLNKLKEMIDQFMPDIIWQDFNLGRISAANLTGFLSYYYNAALDAGKEVVATGKDGITPRDGHAGQVLDFERGGPADITKPYWLTDDAISSSSWSYTTGMRYYSQPALIHSFVDRVSKGGNLLLNLSPMADGTFPQEQKDILTAFGKFLRQAGTAIYNTRTWAVYGEGPTKLGGGGMGAPSAMTNKDVRYTTSKDGDAVYAIIMGWPGSQFTLASVTSSRFALGSGKVFLFGPNGDGKGATELSATQSASGLSITLPSAAPYQAVAYALKISKSGAEPAATPWTGTTPIATPDGGVGGSGGGGGSDAGAAGSTGTSGTAGRTGTAGAGGITSSATVVGGSGASGSSRSNSSGATSGSSNTGGTRASGGTTAAGGSSSASASPPQGGSASSGATSGASSAKGGVASSGSGSGSASGGMSSSSADQAGGGSSSGAAGRSGTAGATATGDSSGCSCSLQGKSSSRNAAALTLFVLVVAQLIRRRRS